MSLYPQVVKRTPPVWTYLIADVRTGDALEEIPLSSVRWSKRLNDSGTLSGSWQLGPNEKRDARLLTTPARSAIFALRDSFPMWGGIIWTRSYDSSSQKVQIGCGDFWSYFDHRKVLPFFNPDNIGQDVTYVASRLTSFTQVDQNEIARQLVQQTQVGSHGINVTYDSSVSGILRDRNYYGYELSDVGAMLRNLANVIDGPDIVFDVRVPRFLTANVVTPEIIMRIGTPLLQQSGAVRVFEYGGNVVSYTWPSDGSKMATKTYAVGDGTEKGLLVGYAEDNQRYADGWPILELEKAYDTVIIPQTLFDHAAADLDAAKNPVTLPSIKVRGDMAPYLSDYSIGDNAQLIIPSGDVYWKDGLDVAVRIVAMDVQPETSAGEDVTLICAPVIDIV